MNEENAKPVFLCVSGKIHAAEFVNVGDALRYVRINDSDEDMPIIVESKEQQKYG
jgi:hypothetical protein